MAATVEPTTEDQKPWELYAAKKPWELFAPAALERTSDALTDSTVNMGKQPEREPSAPSPDKTFMSQMAVEVPKVMSDLEIDFPKSIEGLSPSETDYLNSLKKQVVLDEASKRIKESGFSKVTRGARQFTAGAAQSLITPENVGLAAATVAAPPVGVGAMAGLAAKAIGEGAGTLSVPGGPADEATKEILNMALMTLGAKGSAELLKGKPTPEVTDASKIQETTAVHGDLRPQPVEVPREVPVEEGRGGVQPQTERGIPEAPQGEVALTAGEVTPPAPKEVPKAPSEAAQPPPEPEVTTEAEPGQLGGGAAHISEFPEDPGNPDIYGIAARVREQRAKAGQTIQIDPGQGVSAIDAVIHGQEVLEKNPLAAEQAVDAFKKNKAISYDGLSATRARAEKEFQAARQTEQKLGTDSPEYQTQFAAAVEWDKASKGMQTEWHKAGRAQQGQTDLDTGTFTGLNRAFQGETGKNIPESKVPKAKKTAKEVSDARQATAGAKENLFSHIRQEYARDAAKSAFDAAKKTVREWAVTKADAETALRVAQKVQADAVKKIQDAAAERAEHAKNKTITANAKRVADAETARRVKEAQLAKAKADVEVRRHQQRIKEANERITKAAADAAKAERKLNVAKADLPTYVWTKAREYIEKGMDNFDDIRVKIATDEGLPLKKVTEAMGKDRKAKFLADEVWKKQQTARRLHEQAKRWLTAQTIPAYKRWLENVPAAFFTAKVMGHGTVALGTHAPTGLFKPLEWGTYFKNFGRMYRMVGSKTFYENQVQDLLRNPNYTVARRAGLVNDPYQFEDYNSPDMLKWMDKFTAMGNRGYAVLKMLRQDMFDRYWNKLPKTSQIAEVAEAIADSVNHATGVVKVHAPKGAAVAFFAPRLELSRAAWLAADPLRAADTFFRWKDATEGDKRFALMQVKEKAWVFGTGMSLLVLNQAILSATGSKQQINGVPESLGGAGFDPMRSDFLKFKAMGMAGSYGNAMTAMARLPARLFVGIENEGKFNKIVYEDENVASILFDFTRSQMSPFMGTVTDLAIGRDFQRRPLPRAGFGLLPGKTNVPKRLKAQGVGPYTWAEYVSVQASPIPMSEAIREVWKAGLGMSEEQIHDYMKAFAILSIMTGTGARVTEDYNIPKQ